MSYRRQIHAGLQQEHRGAVSHAVRMQALTAQRRGIPCRKSTIPREYVANTEARQSLTSLIAKDCLLRSRVQPALGTELSQDPGGLRPQGTDARLAPLADKLYLRW